MNERLVLVILGCALAAAAAAVLWRGLFGGWRPWWRHRGRRCQRCGYDMRETAGRTCSECGREHRSERSLRRRRPKIALLALGAVLAYAGVATAWVGMGEARTPIDLAPNALMRVVLMTREDDPEAIGTELGQYRTRVGSTNLTIMQRTRVRWLEYRLMEALRDRLRGPDADESAAWSAWHLEGDIGYLRPLLGRLVADPDPRRRDAALYIFSATMPTFAAEDGIEPWKAEMLAGLMLAGVDEDAAELLSSSGRHAAPAVPILLKVLESGDPGQRALAAEVLGSIGGGAAPALPRLRQLLEEERDPYLAFPYEYAIEQIEAGAHDS